MPSFAIVGERGGRQRCNNMRFVSVQNHNESLTHCAVCGCLIFRTICRDLGFGVFPIYCFGHAFLETICLMNDNIFLWDLRADLHSFRFIRYLVQFMPGF